MAEQSATIALDPDTPRARYALETLLHLLGVEARPAAAGTTADIAYGNAAGRCRIPAGPQERWDDPRPRLTRDDGVPLLHRPGGPASAGALGFDVLYATYACLCGTWEAADPKDEVGTPIAARGWLAENGLLSEPLVHIYAELVARELRAAGIRAALPPPAFALTSDVDANFGHLFAVRESFELLRRDARAFRPEAVRRAVGLGRRALWRARRRTDPNDRWDEWLGIARAHGGRPTFFVASYGLFERGSARHDPPYDARHPEVAATLRRLAEEGAELGVHFSLSSRSTPSRIREERERLEDAVGVPVLSARHHWWALGHPPEPTLRMHADAGIAVDCSFGFNDAIGFRRGIAYPFRPFDPVAEEALPIWSLPTLAMDIALFRPELRTDAALPALMQLADAVARHGGALVLNWHAHALNPRVLAGAGAGLHAFLDAAAARLGPLRTPLELAAEAGARSSAGAGDILESDDQTSVNR